MTLPRRSFGRWLIHFTASGFGAGRVPLMPGTFGTLVAIPIYLLLREAGTALYAAIVVVMFVLGIWICNVAGRDLGDDASSIVWDEVVGYLISMFMAPPGWEWVAAGFVLFRFFDIVKPFPIRTLERRIHGGVGTMLDDVLAGFYVLAILQMVTFLQNKN